jgi:hypothetical protein
MTRPFSLAFKQKMIERLTGNDALSATQLSRQTGVRQQNLSRWLEEARSLPFVGSDVVARRKWTWYNGEHRHSAIRYVTPNERYYGREKEILARRQRVYERARQTHPGRWTGATRNWAPVLSVTLNPAAIPEVVQT